MGFQPYSKVADRSLDPISRADFGILLGLPFLPPPVTWSRFLQSFSLKDALALQVNLENVW